MVHLMRSWEMACTLLVALLVPALDSGAAEPGDSNKAKEFVTAASKYLKGFGAKTLELPTSEPRTVFRMLSPAADARLVNQELSLADKKLDKRLMRVLGDKDVGSVQLLGVNLDALEGSQAGDQPTKLCEGAPAYCLTVRSSGWSKSNQGVRRITAKLGGSPEDGGAHGTALFVEENGVLLATIQVRSESFTLRQVEGGVFAITKALVEDDRLLDDVQNLPPKVKPTHSPSGVSTRGPSEPGTSGPTTMGCPNPATTQIVDIVVGFTERAKGLAFRAGYDVKQLVRFAEELANVSFEKSEINGRVRVAEIQPTKYEETEDFTTTVRDLLNPSGALQDLRAARKKRHADIAVLVVENSNPRNCGKAAGIRVEKELAYAAVNWRCLTDRFSFIHEVGHLVGAWHDPGALDPALDVQPPYAHGYVTSGSSPLATIMAYRESCSAPCGRHWFWSNPDLVSEDGDRLGTVETNFDACVWRQRLTTVAGFDGG